jgi:SAM-dependent methyltransferase
MSDFSDVDVSANAERLIGYLDATDGGSAAIKSYIAAAARRAVTDGLVLDLGCGVGHDLRRLAELDVEAVGVDSSGVMLERARRALTNEPGLARADAAFLPFRDASFAGCRAERVIQHVSSPTVVIDEIARVLRPNGFAALFEPDFSTFRVASDTAAESFLSGLLRVRHPAVGGDLFRLLEARGFEVDDVVTESSRGYSLDGLPVNAAAVVAAAVSDGRAEPETATRWLDEQRSRSTDGSFRGSWDKVLVVARRVA